MEENQLKNVLELHRKWINKEPGGEKPTCGEPTCVEPACRKPTCVEPTWITAVGPCGVGAWMCECVSGSLHNWPTISADWIVAIQR